MGVDRQLEDLCSVYAERSDAELLDLHENREDLTDLAQQALAQVMKERGISASGVPVPAPVRGRAEEDETAPGDDEFELAGFQDAFQASEALRVLAQAEIPHRILNGEEVEPDRAGARVALRLIVASGDRERAREVLQAAMNLFPPPEGSDVFEEPQGLLMVGVFERADALLVAHALGSGGISFVWNDGRGDLKMSEEDVRIEVYELHLDRAQHMAQQALSARE